MIPFEQKESSQQIIPQPKQLSNNELKWNKIQVFEQLQKKYSYLGFKLLATYTSILTSQFIINSTLSKWIFNNIYRKRYLGSLYNPKPSEQTTWVNKQVKQIMKSLIRFNSIVFCTKTILDQYYSDIIKKNLIYYQSNSSLHFKIGALTGLITYAINLPLLQFLNLKNTHKIQTNFVVNVSQKKNIYKNLSQTFAQFFTIDTMRKIMNNFSFTSLMGVIIYRAIYFGGYEKIKTKYQSPINDYIIAPIGCSALVLIVSPIDQIRFLQMTSHKDKSFYDIVIQKGYKLWNVSGQKIYVSIARQATSMSFFVAAQNLCKYLIKLKNSTQ